MEKNKSILDAEYTNLVKENPDKKFVVYLRVHPGSAEEDILKTELVDIYGECKELKEQKLLIFIINGNKVTELIDKINYSNTEMYLSFIQTVDELINNNDDK